jgi:hypothetical protein
MKYWIPMIEPKVSKANQISRRFSLLIVTEVLGSSQDRVQRGMTAGG